MALSLKVLGLYHSCNYCKLCKTDCLVLGILWTAFVLVLYLVKTVLSNHYIYIIYMYLYCLLLLGGQNTLEMGLGGITNNLNLGLV